MSSPSGPPVNPFPKPPLDPCVEEPVEPIPETSTAVPDGLQDGPNQGDEQDGE